MNMRYYLDVSCNYLFGAVGGATRRRLLKRGIRGEGYVPDVRRSQQHSNSNSRAQVDKDKNFRELLMLSVRRIRVRQEYYL